MPALEGMLTEQELMELLKLKPSELKYLRDVKNMPYVQLSKNKRLYLEKDLMEWFEKNRVTADRPL